jgi:drug/metabolite transporter (DMT)-like permease
LSNAFLYVVTVLIWGSTWFAIEHQLGVVAPEVSIAYRYLGSAGLLFIWCKVKGLNTSFNLKSHRWFAVMGLLMFCLNYILAYRAQLFITSALSAIAFSSMLWMNIINARLFFGIRGGSRLYMGAMLGVIGIGVLFGPKIARLSLSDVVLFGTVLALLGALLASWGNIASQAAQKEHLPVLQSNAWSMLYGGLFTTVIALLSGQTFNFDLSFNYIASLAYLTIFGSIVAFGAYLTLVGRIGAHRAGYAAVMFPVVALIISMLFEGLSLDRYILIGFALVLGGNLLVLTDRQAHSK